MDLFVFMVSFSDFMLYVFVSPQSGVERPYSYEFGLMKTKKIISMTTTIMMMMTMNRSRRIIINAWEIILHVINLNSYLY